MPMPLIKAKAVLKSYRENDFNASKALQSLGYTKDTANKQSGKAIKSAIKKVATEELKNIVNSSSPINSLLQFAKITEDELSNEYLSLIKQNKDLSTKLKAMLPLLAQHGIKWSDDKVDVQVPILNVTVKQNNTATDKDIIDTTSP